MSSEYPDVLGDLVEARQRFEVNGVHYVPALQPGTISPGETTALQVWLQSCWGFLHRSRSSCTCPRAPPLP